MKYNTYSPTLDRANYLRMHRVSRPRTLNYLKDARYSARSASFVVKALELTDKHLIATNIKCQFCYYMLEMDYIVYNFIKALDPPRVIPCEKSVKKKTIFFFGFLTWKVKSISYFNNNKKLVCLTHFFLAIFDHFLIFLGNLKFCFNCRGEIF